MTDATGAPISAHGPLLAANVGSEGMQVDPEVLLRARNILRAKSVELLGWLHRASTVKVGLCGPDPISQPAADAFNAKAQLILEQATVFANSLGAAADQLEQTAKSYGATEEQAEQSFNAFQERAEVTQERTGYPVRVGPSGTGGAFDPIRAGMQRYAPLAQPAPRAPGDLSPLANPPAAGPANPFPGLSDGQR